MGTCMLRPFRHVWLFVTPWTIPHEAPVSLRFSRQEHWSGLPCPPPGNLPDPGIEPASLTSPALAGRFLLASRASKAVHMGSGQVICFFLNWGPVSGVSGCWHKELWCPEICPRCPVSRKTCYLGLVPILVSFDILEESLRSLKWVFSGSCLGENCLTFWAYFFLMMWG